MRKKYWPDKLPAVSTITQTGDKKVAWLHSDSTVYAFNGANLYKSADWGGAWTEIALLPATINQVRKLSDGKILVVSNNGNIYLSDAAEANFVKVHEFSAGATSEHSFGLRVYDQMIFASEYGVKKNKAYMSHDNGATWEQIFEHPDPDASHVHDICYDPYENLIWITTGDGINQRNIFWSADFGNTWETMPHDHHIRATQIIPMPECVLFGSDDFVGMTIWRHDRPDKGTHGSVVRPYAAWSPIKKWPHSSPWMNHAAIQFGGSGAAYFGWLQPASSAAVPSAIYGTRDGYTFAPIWVERNLPSTGAASPLLGILGVYGPDSAGNLAARLVSSYGGSDEQLLKIELPTWVEM